LSLSDHSKQIAFIAKVHDDEYVVAFFDDLVQRYDIGMPGCELVKGDFSSLKVALA